MPRDTQLSNDDRAVASTVGYVLTLTITAALISGLLVGGGQYVQNERQQVTTQELNVLSEQLAAGLTDADRLSQADAGAVKVRVSVDLPRLVARSAYTVSVEDAPNAADQPYRHVIRLSSEDAEATTSLTLETTRDVVSEVSSGGPVVVVYRDADGDSEAELVVTRESLSSPSLEPVAVPNAEVTA